MQSQTPFFRFSLIALGVAAALGYGAAAQAADAAADQQGEEVETVTVTGFRASLASSTNAKRDSTNFTDSVFAEDIGKFPDLNIAESLNRIPGVQLTREINGEGLNIAIRGLGTNFTKTVLNGAQIAVASSGRTDAQNQNREVDLDLFPTELFTRLDVNKTPMPSMIEGGVSGTVNMRSARPFDNKDQGMQMSYQLQGNYGEISGEFSPRGAITGSWTNEQFGVLVGLAGVSTKTQTTGYETIGWTNANLNDRQCGVAAIDNDNNPSTAPQNICNYAIGGNGFVIPANVPATAGNGLVAGELIDAAWLEQHNPGVTARQMGEAILPRLSRPSYTKGTRDRYSGLISLEYRPSDTMRFYADTMYSDAKRDFDRLDMNWVVRNSNWMVPINTHVDENGVFTSGTFANSQFFLEARPYSEEVDFWNFNPGAHFDFTENVHFDVQLNKSRSLFFREAPTVLVNSPQGITVQFENEGGDTPTITATNLDFNNPNAGWSWTGGRVNIQNEKRLTKTSGAHADLLIGDDKSNIKIGAAYDEISRGISGRDNSARWEDVACRAGLNSLGNSPTPRANCVGGPYAAVPQSALASYLMPGPAGFITVDFDRFKADTDYKYLEESAPESNGVATGASSGGVNERTLGAYVEFNGNAEFFDRPLRFNLGGRYVQTDQAISGPVTIAGVRQEQTLLSDYDAFLPSFNAAVNVQDDFIIRMSGSRTLTRANPSAMLPATTFSDVSAQQASQGNPDLAPYLSTNFDLGGEYYTGDEGYVGLTLFTKQINGFTVLGSTTRPFTDLGIPFTSLSQAQQDAINLRGGPNVASVTVNQQVNASGTLTIQGYEAIWVQPLKFVLDGLGFSTNYTRVSQHADGAGIPAQAVGISPVSYNFTGYYENHGATIRISYNHNSEQISSGLGQNAIPYGQYFTDAYGQLDLSASYEFTNLPTSPQITLNMNNITGEKQRTTFVDSNATWTWYDPGYTILLGIRGKF